MRTSGASTSPFSCPAPGGLEDVREVRFDPSVSGGQVGFVYRSDGDVRALLTQFRASLDERFIHKAAGPDTEVERVAVKGQTGFWLEGAPHEFFYVTREGEPRPETLRLARTRFTGRPATARFGSRVTSRRQRRSQSRGRCGRPVRERPSARHVGRLQTNVASRKDRNERFENPPLPRRQLAVRETRTGRLRAGGGAQARRAHRGRPPPCGCASARRLPRRYRAEHPPLGGRYPGP